MHFALADNGSLVYVPGSVGGGNLASLVWVGRDGDEERIAAPTRAYGHPRLSPDGTRVAIDIVDGDNTDIWIWNLAEERLSQLTFYERADAFPLWTPDSARIVFASSREGGGLFWKAADGTGSVDRLKEGAARPWAWAADGRLIFNQAPGDIGVLTMEGERTVEMLLDAEYVEAAPALSPDGRWLAYESSETGTPLIHVKPFPNLDGQWNVSLDIGMRPVWSPDGSELFYWDPQASMLMVAQVETEPTFSNSTPRPLLSTSGYFFVSPVGRRFDLAPDGDRFVFLRSGGGDLQTSDDADFSRLIFVEHWFEELKRLVPTN